MNRPERAPPSPRPSPILRTGEGEGRFSPQPSPSGEGEGARGESRARRVRPLSLREEGEGRGEGISAASPNTPPAEARARLAAVLATFDRLAVAVSGGVDSMTLAWLARRQPGLAVTVFHAVSPAVPAAATARVLAYAERDRWDVRVIDAGELADERYLANPVDRCFFCKTDLYGAVRRRTGDPIASGANLDDLGDYRPGLRAAAEHGVRHPLVEAGIGKAAVRALAAEEGLADLAELPASPCLSSRVETGLRITPAALALVEAAEALLRAAFPGAETLRARLRRDRLELQLDAVALDALPAPARAELAARVGHLAAERGLPLPVTLAPYARGSAFLHPRRAP